MTDITSPTGRKVLGALAATGIALLSPTAASAATRYADPASADTTGTCAAASPCRIDRAVAVAQAGETVVVKSGTYTVNYSVVAGAAIDVRGESGKPRPSVIGTGGSATIDMSYGGTLSDLYVSASGNLTYAVSVEGAVVDRVEAEAFGSANGAVELRPHASGVVLRNSVARGAGTSSDAIQVKDNGLIGNATVIGTTAVSAGGRGVSVKASLATTTLKNSIFRGPTDIEVKNTATHPQVSYSIYRAANSDTARIVAGTGNKDAVPLFSNEAGGDFSQADGSPSLDAGGADALAGTYDFAGRARTYGAAIDMGAHESQPSSGGGSSDPGTGTSDQGSGSTTDNTSQNTDSTPGTGSTGDPAPTPELPPATDPVLGLSIGLGEVKGATRVKLPGTDEWVPMTADTTVPVGALIDATNGTIELTSVRDASGKTQTGTFWGGVFQVRQSRTEAVTELALTGGDFSRCRAKGTRRGKLVASRTSRHSSRVRRLWGRDRGGRFRTRGRNGSATVRGTRWLTEDRCNGTLFKVAEGAIDVRDDRKRKTVRLKRGKSYLAAAAPAKKRKR
jgi:hypothetical protein